MDFNFTKEGKQYDFHAVTPKRSDFNALGDKAARYLAKLEQIISEKHQEEDNTQKQLMISSYGCIERLTAFLLQSKRLAQHAQEIYKQSSPRPGEMLAFIRNEVLFDFESLIFHARALLDRLTFYLAKQFYNQDCSRLNKLRNVLDNFKQKDPRVQQALSIVDESLPHFSGLLIDTEDNVKSLRSGLIHKSTTWETTTCVFTFHSLPDGRAIRFDYEIQQYPLIGSAWLLSKYVPFFALNILGIYMGAEYLLPLKECEPIWENRLSHFSYYLDPTSSGPRFSIVKMNPSGADIITKLLKPSVLKPADTIPTK